MILVTGGTGFVGSHLILHLLENGVDVRATYRNPKSQSYTYRLFEVYDQAHLFDKIKWCSADITDIPSLENAFVGVTQVYHCAAVVSFDPAEEDIIRKINIEGTANIVNLCLEFKIDKLCFMSSIAVISEFSKNYRLVDEDTEWDSEKFHSDYAISKHGAEMEVWRGQQEGLNVLVLNPGIIIGAVPKRESVAEKETLIDVCKRWKSFYTNGTSGFVAVTDVAKVAVELMNGNIINQRFILVAENLSYRDFMNIIAYEQKTKRPNISLRPYFIKLLSKADWLFSNLTRTRRRLPKSIARASYSKNYYSNKKISEVLATPFKSIAHAISELPKT